MRRSCRFCAGGGTIRGGPAGRPHVDDVTCGERVRLPRGGRAPAAGRRRPRPPRRPPAARRRGAGRRRARRSWRSAPGTAPRCRSPGGRRRRRTRSRYRSDSARSTALSTVSRSVTAAPASSSDVAAGTGSSAPVCSTLSPMPRTAARSSGRASVPTTSARMPATLRGSPSSGTRTSFGHLSRASTPQTRTRASVTATPASRLSHDHRVGGTGGRSSTETARAARGGAVHRRSRRPRPACWSSVVSTRPSGSPARARAATSAFVDPVAGTTSSARQAGRSPAVTARRRPAALSGGRSRRSQGPLTHQMP